MQEACGSLRHEYVGHIDLSLVGDNTALVIAHAEPSDDQGRPHIIVDLIRVWEPADFPDGHIHLGSVEAELKRRLSAFKPRRFTFDQ